MISLLMSFYKTEKHFVTFKCAIVILLCIIFEMLIELGFIASFLINDEIKWEYSFYPILLVLFIIGVFILEVVTRNNNKYKEDK